MNQQQAQYTTVAELLQRIDAARARMGTSNANRTLLYQCRVALEYLSALVPVGEQVSAGGIILP